MPLLLLLLLIQQVTRTVFGDDGKPTQVSDMLEVPIKPGWKAGTKITYAGMCTATLQHQRPCFLIGSAELRTSAQRL